MKVKFFDKLFGNKEEKINNNLNKIRNQLIDDIIKYVIENNSSTPNMVMTENCKDGIFRAFPVIDSEILFRANMIYINKYGEKNLKLILDLVSKYIRDLCQSDDLTIKLGEAYNKAYHEWEEEYYKDADDIEEEMWHFETEGKSKYKGFLEQAAEHASDYKGTLDADVFPELAEKEVNLLPYIEHDENPNEIVSLEDGSIELEELL